MPTIILLDVSLSMLRPLDASTADINDDTPSSSSNNNKGQAGDTVLDLARQGVNQLLDHITANCPLEYVCLMTFSSTCDTPPQCAGVNGGVSGNFTRDLSQLRAGLASITSASVVDGGDSTCVYTALCSVDAVLRQQRHLVADSAADVCRVILVSEGGLGLGATSLPSLLRTLHASPSSPVSPLPPALGARASATAPAPRLTPLCYAARLEVVLLNSGAFLRRHYISAIYRQLIRAVAADGSVHCVDGPLNSAASNGLFSRLADTHYSPMMATLEVGNLTATVAVTPAPQSHTDESGAVRHISREVRVCGFISTVDVANPAAISRHLLLSAPQQVKSGSVDEAGSVPSVCVLLHDSIKRESCCALVLLADGWFGLLYSHTDKKACNLVLAVFTPGVHVVPWLGDLSRLSVASPQSPSTTPTSTGSGGASQQQFPVRSGRKCSYQQSSCVTWARHAGLQSDVQKVLRHARKLPDKTSSFYKELNRVRCAALSLAFYAALDAVADVLDRECQLLPANAHPDCALQLSHAASALRMREHRTLTNAIQPMWTRFQMDT